MGAVESAVVPAAEEPAESPQKRRRLNYQVLAEKNFPKIQLPTDDDWPLPDKDVLRFAARLWAKSAGEVVGDSRSPLPRAGDRTQTVARCFQCDECEKFSSSRESGKMTNLPFSWKLHKLAGIVDGHASPARLGAVKGKNAR